MPKPSLTVGSNRLTGQLQSSTMSQLSMMCSVRQRGLTKSTRSLHWSNQTTHRRWEQTPSELPGSAFLGFW